jgi:hypothetical protein
MKFESKIKLFFGILIPLVIIITLAVISNMGDSIKVSKQTVNYVILNELFTNDSKYYDKNIILQNITLQNDYFLPRKYALPMVIVCLNDKEGSKGRMSLSARYSEGTYNYNYNRYLFDDIFFGFDSYYYNNRAIELPTNGKKMIKISVQPQYRYNTQDDYLKGYDEILIVETNNNKGYYSYCDNIEASEFDNAVHVNLIE